MARKRLLLALTAAALLLVPPNATRSAETTGPAARPPEHFAMLPFVEDPELSPDGSRLAAKVATGGKQYLGLFPLFGGKPTILPADDLDINWWRWVNDEWLVIGVGTTEKVMAQDLYVRRALGINATTGKIVPLFGRVAGQNADDVIWVATDGTPRIRLALQRSIFISDEGFWPEVIEVDVSTGKSKRVQRPVEGVTQWYADGTGAVRIGIGHANGGRHARLLYRERDGQLFRTVDRANSRKDESLLVPRLFLAEPGQALAYSDKDGFDALYRLDLSTLTLGERLFGASGYDIGGLVVDAAAGRPLGVRVTEDAPRTHWLDPELASLQAAIDKATGDRRATILSMDRARQRLIVHVGSANTPGGIYFMSLEAGRLQRIAQINEAIGSARLHPVRTIRYKARDGLEIAAVLTLPAGRTAKSLPLIVMPHGGPFHRDEESWDWWSQFLADRGYAVVQPNFRGSSGYGSAFAAKGEGQWGLAMQDDLLDAIAHLTAQGITDPKRVCIVGGSYGGYAAMRAAQRDGSHYRCAVSFAGVSDLPALLRYDSRFLNGGARSDWVREQAPDLTSVSPINFPQQSSIPLLLIHGK